MPNRWRNLLTDDLIDVVQQPDGRWTLDLADVFRVIPVALLVGEA